MEIKTVSIKEIKKNDFILSPIYYIDILPFLKQEFIFQNKLTGNTGRIRLNLDKMPLEEKCFIYYLLKQKEKYNKIHDILKG